MQVSTITGLFVMFFAAIAAMYFTESIIQAIYRKVAAVKEARAKRNESV